MAVVKRQPLAYYNEDTMSATEGMCGLYRYYGIDGPQLIAVNDDTVYVGNDSTGAMTPIQTLTSSNRPMMFLTYDNLLMMTNGYDPIYVYDGSPAAVCWQLGSCQAVTASSGTGITATNVSYQITIDSNAYICGAVSNTIASLSNQAVTLTYIPLGTEGAVDRRIYRKDSGTSGVYKLVTTISDNSTTTYTDNTPSGSLGAAIATVTDPVPVGAWFLMFAERLFITADPNNPNRLYYSEPFLPGYIQVNTNLDYLDIDPDDGDQIQGIAVVMGTMVCIKQNNVRKLNIANAQSNVDPATWSAEPPFAYVGTPARYSICTLPTGVVFLSWDGWYNMKGATPEPFLPQFDPLQILPAAYRNVVCCYNDGQLYASYTSASSGSQFPNQVMVWDYKLNQFSIDTYSASCFASATGVNEAGELYIGDAQRGFVYKAEQGSVWSTVSSLTQAQEGTTAGTYVGGTQNTAFIQIGEPVAPLAIPNGICLFWDNSTTSPGVGWTEITAYPYTYPVISTVSGNTGGSSAHTHTINGSSVTSTNTGVSGNCGDGNPQAEGAPHDHTINGTSDSMFADPNFFGLRVFYKNSATTEYEFPIGSILMFDQSGAPNGWISYATSNNGYLKLIAPVATAPNWVVNTAYTVGQYVTAQDPFSLQQTIYKCQIAHTSGVYDNTYNSIMSTSYTSDISQAPQDLTYTNISITFADDLAAGYWVAQYNNLGFMQSASHAHPYGVVTPFQTGASPSQSNQSDSGDLGAHNAHTHYMIGVTNSTNTSATGSSGEAWDLDRIEINFIKKLVTGETPWDGTDTKNVVALFWDIGSPATPSNGWSEIGATCLNYSSIIDYAIGNLVTYGGSSYQCIQAGTGQEPDTSPAYWTAYSAPQIYLKSMNEYLTPQANNAYTHDHGDTPAIQTSLAIQTWCNGGYRAQTGLQHSHVAYGVTSDIAIPNPAWVSFRMWQMPLGLMATWNNAVTTDYTNGLYYSPNLQLNVAQFGDLYFNAQKLPTDKINFYFASASTVAGLDGLSVTMGSSTFTHASHGLVNGNRVSIIAIVMPTGLLGTIMYYVVNVATNTFQVSLTLGGAAVTFSGGSGVTVYPWSDEISNSDTIIAETPNVWVAYVIEFIAANTANSNPTLVMANDYILQFSYTRSGTTAETSVEFIYTTGRMNQDSPYVDKIYKRFASDHLGTTGQVQIQWATDNASNSFLFDLSAFPRKYVSYFQDSAMGENVSISYYKNDLNDFKLLHFTGQYTAQPMIY